MDGEINPDGRSDLAKTPMQIDSATESEGDEHISPDKDKLPGGLPTRSPSASREPLNRGSPVLSRDPSPLPSGSGLNSSKSLPSDSESSPARPAKKPKILTSSDDDSEEERKRRVAQLKSGAGSGAGGAKRGTRQPLKRGGKRF